MTTAAPTRRILVWDLPTRVFHWLLAGSFAVAFLTAESERWRDVHVLAGYTMLLLIAFRVLWGVVGSRHARFASFPLAPRRALAYVRDLLRGNPPHFAGHNPAGAIAIYALIAATLVVGATGYLVLGDVGGHALEELHEGAAYAMLALVAVHIAGVLVGSIAHRENLAKSMVTGYKEGERDEGIRGQRFAVAVVLMALVATLLSGAVPVPGLEPSNAGAPGGSTVHGNERVDGSSTERHHRSDAHPGD